MHTTNNRTYWPTTGGAVSFQPGWFRGHLTALVQVNLGFGTDGPDHGPPNMSNPMVKPFQVQGPTNNPYPGTVCLPQVPLPVNAKVQAGDKATIQIVELAQHGAALYSVSNLFRVFWCDRVCVERMKNRSRSTVVDDGNRDDEEDSMLIQVQCVDIIFAEPGDPRINEVNETNCFNSSDLGFADMYTIITKHGSNVAAAAPSGAVEAIHRHSWAGWLPFVFGAVFMML